MAEKQNSPFDADTGTLVMPRPAEPLTRKAPLYHVILHDDDQHTYEYVVKMLMQLFGKDEQRAFQHAKEVDSTGVTIVDTTSLERAELKRDQIRAFGPDPLLAKSAGSMSATIEPAE
jgi:ATP-dependent Clp protease adaptor protein ClpS